MLRSFETELLECDGVPEAEVRRVYEDLTRIHRLLGDTASIISAVRRDRLPVRRILDIGCGRGGVLADIRKRLDIDVMGVELRRPAHTDVPFRILEADGGSGSSAGRGYRLLDVSGPSPF